jgi:alkylated DNA nucleotide flippase Atl1
MANEQAKDFNAMLLRNKDMPKIQRITDEKSIEKYGGERMYFAPPVDYDRVMKAVPFGKVVTVGQIRDFFAKANHADFTDPITAGIFVSIAAWASEQRDCDKTPYWRTLKADGELNPKYPGGIEAQKEKLAAEGHIVVRRGRSNIRYYVKDYRDSLYRL